MPEEEKKIPKKRGRKKKPVDPNKIEVVKIPKKRGRKPKEKYIAKPDITPLKHDENYILHISDETESNIKLDEMNPLPFDSSNNNNNISDVSDNVQTKDCVCLWCCHSFMNQNWGLPFIKNKVHTKTYGNFCSPECVAAYAFDDISLTDDTKWNVFSIVNSLGRELYSDPTFICKLAPPRNSLKIFGGKYTIDEFRNISVDKNRVVKVYLPPTISILHNVEEIQEDIASCNLKNNAILQQDERYKMIQNNLRLKRDKPLLNKKNTLEHCMNIEIN